MVDLNKPAFRFDLGMTRFEVFHYERSPVSGLCSQIIEAGEEEPMLDLPFKLDIVGAKAAVQAYNVGTSRGIKIGEENTKRAMRTLLGVPDLTVTENLDGRLDKLENYRDPLTMRFGGAG